MIKCIVLFSGGLDSVCTTHLLKSQNIDVLALHYVLPFYSRSVNPNHTASIKACAAHLGVPLRIEEDADEFLAMLKNPRYGYGKNVNPCIDCRIYRFKRTYRIMQEIGAHFFATGEVCGQRPMSQGMQTMMLIENQAEVDGVVLRPLSAKLLPPTNAEKNGWIKRENMLDIKGRGRKIQLAYALQHGLHHDTPAGGCLLTQRYTTLRLQDLLTHNPGFSLDDLRLIAYGRIFRINRQCIFVLGRHHDDNQRIINLFRPSDLRLQLDGEEGPLGLVRGHASEDERKNMARILARFSKARDATQTAVVLIDGETRTRYDVTPAALHEFDHLRVTDRDE